LNDLVVRTYLSWPILATPATWRLARAEEFVETDQCDSTSPARRMGGAKRYPSIASYGDDGFRGAQLIYALHSFPGCCAAPSARLRASSTRYDLRRGALLIRGPSCRSLCCGSRLCGAARRALHRVRDTSGICSRRYQVICPSGGLSTGVSSLISDFPKNISVPTHPKSDLELFASHPTEGRIAIVTDAGRDAVDAAAFCARKGCRAS
jgi:hypothetical protein